MSKQNKLITPFDNTSKFNKDEEFLRTSLENDTEYCINIDVNHFFPDNALPIHYACLYNSLKYFTNPILPLYQINIPGGAYGSTPMMFTIYNSSYKALLFLLLNGADISLKNTKSSDVLSLCVRFDDVLGMILVLSFTEDNILIKRYLKYSLIKNSLKTWKFLTKRGLEIEYNTCDTKKHTTTTPMNIKIEKSIENIKLFILLGFFIIILIYSNALRLFFSSCFIFSYFAILSSSIPLIFNILYSIHAYFVLFSSRPSSFFVYFIVFFHLLCFFLIYFMKDSQLKINKIRDSKELITHLVLEDEYNYKRFCYTCLNRKIEGTKHCSVCKKCVLDYNHHCPFFNKCISKKSIVVFNTFILFSMILYTLAICKAHLRLQKLEFLICLFVSFGSFVVFLINWKNQILRIKSDKKDIVNDKKVIVNDKNDIVNDNNSIVNDNNSIVNDNNSIANDKKFVSSL